jgi:nickel-dependent lactate racemase
MRVAVHFGDDIAELDVCEDCLVEPRDKMPDRAIEDVASAVAKAIESPLEFPPLRQAVVPGDHVAIVLDEGVPRPMDVLGPLVECLIEAGVQPRDIRIVEVTSSESSSNGLASDSVPPGIGLVRHDPKDRTRLSYVAATKAGTRVYLNRDVVDADLVVLCGRVNYHPLLGYSGTGSSLFPGLADETAKKEFRGQISSPPSPESRAARRHESDEVTWLLGVQFAIQLVVGRESEIVQVVAGHCPDVQRESQRALNKTWRRTVRRRAELLIAAISGNPRTQGFEELGTALDVARGLVCEGGRIAVLSSIQESPGPGLKSVQKLVGPSQALDYLRRHISVDAICAWQIANACQQARVYLLSRLAPDRVENLGITPIGQASEVQRLVGQVRSCLIVNDAQLARVTVEGEDEESAL